MASETTGIPRVIVDLRQRAHEAMERERLAELQRAQTERLEAVMAACRTLESLVRGVLELDVEIDERAFERPEDVRVEIDSFVFTKRWNGYRSVLVVELYCDECFTRHWYEVPSLARLYPLLTKLLRCADAFREMSEDE